MTYKLTPTGQALLTEIEKNGGYFDGTLRLIEKVPADPRELIRTLQRCRHAHLITSSHSHGGRGHRSLHRLTAKGRRHVQPK